MKVIYIDTSVLVSLFFEGSIKENREFRNAIGKADEVLSSLLIEAEFFSVLTREKIPRDEGLQFLRQISYVIPDRSLASEINRILSLGYVRGADVFHLACALYLDPPAHKLLFLTADAKQRDLAKLLKFSVLE